MPEKADKQTSVNATLGSTLIVLYPWARSVSLFLCRNSHQAEDLVHDAFVAALESDRVPDRVDELKRWLRVVMFRRQIRASNRLKREIISAFRLSRAQDLHDHLPNDTRTFLDATATLSARQRACVVLRYVEDLSEQEVATTLDISLGTVKAHLAQARKRLRQSLDNTD